VFLELVARLLRGRRERALSRGVCGEHELPPLNPDMFKTEQRPTPSSKYSAGNGYTRRRSVRPVVAAVVQPVAKRLARIEALLIEMRYEQDVQLRRAAALEVQLDTLTERVFQRANHGGATGRAERTRGTQLAQSD
jgi:hypothetical protein